MGFVNREQNGRDTYTPAVPKPPVVSNTWLGTRDGRDTPGQRGVNGTPALRRDGKPLRSEPTSHTAATDRRR